MLAEINLLKEAQVSVGSRAQECRVQTSRAMSTVTIFKKIVLYMLHHFTDFIYFDKEKSFFNKKNSAALLGGGDTHL